MTSFAVAGALAGCALESGGLGVAPHGGATDDAGISNGPSGTSDAHDAAVEGASEGDPAPPLDAGLDATDAASEPPDAMTALIPPDAAPPLPPLVGRWNIDGPTYVGTDFPGTWTAASVPGVCGPSNYEATSALHGTKDAPLFAGEAFGNPATCTVGSGLAPGTYRVTLLFAEIYWGDGCPGGGGAGSRVFDIVIEGRPVLSNFDILAASGGCLASTTSEAGAPVVKSFDVAVTDGTIDIALPASADNGKLSALEVSGPL